ncbi:MFS transporter [Photobacterium sp. 2_MG-2023]|uniref:MFS transporter n=1 Tax=Photobacterium arenosum TaxID=2774143 RepID=A0ABR9BKG9_9GAMM|nr:MULTISPECIES: MFS transporter [Photobacterium]MBD8512846.1 MFS transporter [Photobacterium arenosum]MBV7261066.1 MFS transporter [Photobacterium sp. WH24]MDO6581001.1 MFS transporter [Photobacterium sp. 2_MG-2023]
MSSAANPLVAILKDRSKALALFVIMLPVLLVTIDNTILNFSLPRIASALSPSAAQQLWIIDAYSIVLAGLLVTMGGAGDRLGHRKMLFIGCSGFAAVSLVVVFSQQAWHLIAGRAVLGFFGAMILPATLALIRSAFEDREERRIAVAVWATCLTIGSALGPLVGGVLLQYYDWQSVFLVALPFLAPVILFAPFCLPESEKQPAFSIDYWSITLSLVAMVSLMFALKHGATEGIDALAISTFICGLVFGVLFVRRQLALKDPLLDLKLFTIPAFSVSIAVNLVSLGLLIGFIYLATQLMQIVLGSSPLVASLNLVPGQVLAIVAGMAVVPVVQRIAPNRVIAFCLVLAGVAFMVFALFDISMLTIAVAFALLNIGVAAITTVTNDLVLSSVPPDSAGSASSVSETAYEAGVVLGTTLIGGAVAWLYRANFVAPAGIDVSVAMQAKETLPGAYAVSQTLNSEWADSLLESASIAFTQSVQLVSLGVAVTVLAVVLVVLKYLKLPSSESADLATEMQD